MNTLATRLGVVGSKMLALMAAAACLACSGSDGDEGSNGGSNSGGSSMGGSNNVGGTANMGGSSTGGGSGNGGSGGSAGSAGSAGSGPNPGDGLCGAAMGQLFNGNHPWNQAVDDAPLDSESDDIIAYLQSNHTEFGRFRLDGPSDEADNVYGITILTADDSTPHESFTENDSFYSPDCDTAPMPIPAIGATEGETSYACESDGDCHLIVIDTDECRLFEMYRADRVSASDFNGGCLAVWDLNRTYPETLRGDHCTSADAAGLPIAAHMFSADDIAAGRIDHALRFIMPNSHIRANIYVRPATHSTNATSGPADAPPYGARVRLRADFDMTGLSDAAQVVARALQTYGMILADGGSITFTATNDRFTDNKWADVGLGPTDLEGLEWTDFEVPELGDRFDWTGDCDHTPVTE